MNDKIKHKSLKNAEGNCDGKHIYKESKQRQELIFPK